jgi:hypothetical protein
VFDPKHYLALLEQKPGALDQAAPLQSWTLPEGFRRILVHCNVAQLGDDKSP